MKGVRTEVNFTLTDRPRRYGVRVSSYRRHEVVTAGKARHVWRLARYEIIGFVALRSGAWVASLPDGMPIGDGWVTREQARLAVLSARYPADFHRPLAIARLIAQAGGR